MKRRYAALFAGCISFFSLCPDVQAQSAPDDSSEDGDEATALNTLYIEGLGPAGLYSLNYERRIHDFNIRGGVSYFSNAYYSTFAMPLGFNYIGIGGRSAHLELGAVTTFVVIDGDGILGDAAGVIASGIVGFRHQSPDGGFNFRIGASPVVGAFGALPWGYISLGGTFGGAGKRRQRAAQEESQGALPAPVEEQAVNEDMHIRGEFSDSKAPTGLGGFAFAMTADEARAACQASGHSWTESSEFATCSAPARSLGLEGDIKMQRCGTQFCQFLLTAPVEDHEIVRTVAELKAALEGEYGPPHLDTSAVPQSCGSTLAECVREQRAYLEYTWKFREGDEMIRLRLGKRRTPGQPAVDTDTDLRLLYKRNPPPKVSLGESETPSGFAGFDFEMTPEQGKERCEESGHSWSQSEKFGACDGPARDIGVDGSVQMLRCGDAYCQVLFISEPEPAQLVTNMGELKAALERKYGPAKESNSAIPQSCTETLVECIESQRAYLEYTWEFPHGESVRLRLGKRPDESGATDQVDHKIRVLTTRRAPKESSPKPEVDSRAL